MDYLLSLSHDDLLKQSYEVIAETKKFIDVMDDPGRFNTECNNLVSKREREICQIKIIAAYQKVHNCVVDLPELPELDTGVHLPELPELDIDDGLPELSELSELEGETMTDDDVLDLLSMDSSTKQKEPVQQDAARKSRFGFVKGIKKRLVGLKTH